MSDKKEDKGDFDVEYKSRHFDSFKTSRILVNIEMKETVLGMNTLYRQQIDEIVEGSLQGVISSQDIEALKSNLSSTLITYGDEVDTLLGGFIKSSSMREDLALDALEDLSEQTKKEVEGIELALTAVYKQKDALIKDKTKLLNLLLCSILLSVILWFFCMYLYFLQ